MGEREDRAGGLSLSFGSALDSHLLPPPGDQEALNFGGCYVDHPYQQSFMMTNHSSSQVFRFEWPHARGQLCFSPQVILHSSARHVGLLK